MEKFEREENIYDYIRDEINISTEISLEFIMKNEEIIQSKSQTIKSLPTQKEKKKKKDESDEEESEEENKKKEKKKKKKKKIYALNIVIL